MTSATTACRNFPCASNSSRSDYVNELPSICYYHLRALSETCGPKLEEAMQKVWTDNGLNLILYSSKISNIRSMQDFGIQVGPVAKEDCCEALSTVLAAAIHLGL